MKYNINKLLTTAVLLLTCVTAWAGDVRTVIGPSENAGTVQASQSDGICTLTVIPASGYYITVDNLTAVKIVDGDNAQAPNRIPGVDDEKIVITPANTDADPSGVTTYTFTMPEDDNYGVEVTAEFQSLITITPSVTLTDWTYGENPKTPEVSNNPGNGAVTFMYAPKGGTDFSETIPTNAGEYTVKASVAAINKYAAGEATANFTIAQADFANVTIAEIANQTYTGEAFEPTVSVTFNGNEVSSDEYTVSYNDNVNAGEATVTLTSTGKNFSTANTKTITFQIEKADVTISFETTSIKLNMTEQDTYLQQPVVSVEGLPITWSSSDSYVTPVADDGTVTMKGVGNFTITASFDGNDNYNSTSASYTLTVMATYDLMVNGIPVTSDNRVDILGDNEKKVRYDGKGMLVLENVDIETISTSLDELIIFLGGENKVQKIISTKDGESSRLTFTTEGNEPGKLILDNTEAVVVSGFKVVLFEQNLTILKGGFSEKYAEICTPVKPMVVEDNETNTVDLTETEEGKDLQNTVINDVLYTLEEENGDGVDSFENCIVLSSTMVDEDIDETITDNSPGTDEFAENFTGLTFMVPAGTGKLFITAKTGEMGVLAVKIGKADPTFFKGLVEFEEITISYAVTEATYVYIYNYSEVVDESSAPGHRASKKTSITVGVRNVGASSENVQSSNNADAADITPDETITEGNVEATLTIENGVAILDDSNITSLPDDLFYEMLFMNSIDLRNTSVTGMIVSREEGAFKGVSKNTYIYMPAGNKSDEPNVVIGKVCNNAVLDADMPDDESFAPSDEFTAQTIVLDRTFDMNEIATVYLPFAVSIESANEFGRFFTFDRAEKGFVKLTEVTADLQAHTPYVFQSKTDNMQIVLRAAKVSMPEESAPAPRRAAGDGMQGCYQNFTSTDAYCLEPGYDLDDIHFVRMQAGDKVKAFQAYLVLEGETSESLRVTDNEAVLTGITVIAVDDAPAVWYTIDGKRLKGKPATKGVYIHAGKKLVIP